MMPMNTPVRILFFGSTTDSVIVLDAISRLPPDQFVIAGVVTQPARPVGRTQTITPTPVETWAKDHAISVLSFESDSTKPWLYRDESQVIDALQPIGADILISASYGQKIPTETITHARFGGINVHPSLLPRWRGADPVPWAIMTGDHQTGVTVTTLSQSFDDGEILAQETCPITPHDTSDPLRTRLFERGATLLIDVLKTKLLSLRAGGEANPKGLPRHSVPRKDNLPYARKFTRQDGYEEWHSFWDAVTTGVDAERVDRKFRALSPWPGLWTILPKDSTAAEKRVKILSMHLQPKKQDDPARLVVESVQLEGKKPVDWKQFCDAYNQKTS